MIVTELLANTSSPRPACKAAGAGYCALPLEQPTLPNKTGQLQAANMACSMQPPAAAHATHQSLQDLATRFAAFSQTAATTPRSMISTCSSVPPHHAWVSSVSPRMDAPFKFFGPAPMQTKGPFHFYAESSAEHGVESSVPPKEHLSNSGPVLLGRLGSKSQRRDEQPGEERKMASPVPLLPSPVPLFKPQHHAVSEAAVESVGECRNLTPVSAIAGPSEPCTPWNNPMTGKSMVEEYEETLKCRDEQLEKTQLALDALHERLAEAEMERDIARRNETKHRQQLARNAHAVAKQTALDEDHEELRKRLEECEAERDRLAAETSKIEGAQAEELRQQLAACGAERARLAAAQAELKAVEENGEKERRRLKASFEQEGVAARQEIEKLQMRLSEVACLEQEGAAAREEIEKLQMRLSEVESERMQIASDNAHLQAHAAEKVQVQQEQTAAYETNLRDQEKQFQVLKERAAVYEERVRGHESELAQREASLDAMRCQLAKVEAQRDKEWASHEKVLQKHAMSIHQFKDFKTVRGFRFKTLGRLHKVEIAHQEGTWQLAVDSEVVRTLAHKTFGTVFKREAYTLDAFVTAPDGREAKIIARMLWRKRQWEYHLMVNSMEVPACWKRMKSSGPGFFQPGVEPPEVIGEAPSLPPSDTLLHDSDEQIQNVGRGGH